MQLTHKPTVLIILDGWGHTDNTVYNAVHSAHKPTWDKIVNKYPNTLISASGLDVGLPAEQMGNSEVGHMNIGSGRVVDQEFTRISRAMENGSFYENEALTTAFKSAAEKDKAVHLLGLLSDGGVHSHQKHIHALMELAAKCNVKKLYLHAFLDGRDTPPKSAEEYINRAQIKMKELGIGQFASIIGRHYAMDRNKNWDRTKLAYDLITQAKSEHQCVDPFIAVDMAYDRDETDEFVRPTSIVKDSENPVTVEEGDVIVFANYRADRARQLARAFTKPEFKAFEREKVPQLAAFVSLTSYKANYEFPVAFPPVSMKNVFGEYISNLGLNQLRIAETEKYAHVTFFFNGGEERVFEGEDRILVPSPHVSTYEQVPEMSADEVTERLLEAINSNKYDAIVCNYANADMVGHTGDFKAATAAIEALDQCLEKVIECTQNVGGELLITADHGNAEQMRSYTTEKVKSQPHTAHTTNLVPLVYLGRSATFLQEKTGTLSDIAPTMLHVMGISQPEEMSGQSLLKFSDEEKAAVVNE